MKSVVAVNGAGLAGLNFAINLASQRTDVDILVFDKSLSNECNTKYASGGIAAASSINQVQIKSHYNDTLLAGCGINNKKAVKEIIKGGPQAIQELLEYGVDFDKDANGEFDRHLEGGHSERRIYHHDDLTGREILVKLKSKVALLPNVKIMKGYMALDILTEHKENEINVCRGVEVLDLNRNKIIKINADAVVIATGGLGQIFSSSTNSDIATGDGIAMALRAEVKVIDMEFVQFHPTALYQENVEDLYLITEAIRGEGAVICDKNGDDVLEKYPGVTNLSPRYEVSLAIMSELIQSNEKWQYLDCTSIDKKMLKENFQSFWQKCSEIGLDPSQEKIPIVPAAHYLCGGIKTDLNGKTSLPSLFAIGECARTGLHGANRLASNSLLEAVVISKNCSSVVSKGLKHKGEQIKKYAFNIKEEDDLDLNSLKTIKHRLKILMLKNAGLIRNKKSLHLAEESIQDLIHEFEELIPKMNPSRSLYELKNMLIVAKSIVTASLKRRKGIGCFCLVN